MVAEILRIVVIAEYKRHGIAEILLKVAFSTIILIGELKQFEDTKEVMRSHKSRKNRQYNGQKKKDKSTNTDIQNSTKENKD
jgi:hypothetical protein